MTDARQRNRDEFPTLAKVMDDFRKVFTPRPYPKAPKGGWESYPSADRCSAGLSLQHGVELSDGREIGKEPDYAKDGGR